MNEVPSSVNIMSCCCFSRKQNSSKVAADVVDDSDSENENEYGFDHKVIGSIDLVQHEGIDAYANYFDVGIRDMGFTDSDSEGSTCSTTGTPNENISNISVPEHFGRIQYNQNGIHMENVWKKQIDSNGGSAADDEEEYGVGFTDRTALKSYRVIDGLGMGGFATVVKVEETITKQIYAMKVIVFKKKKNIDQQHHIINGELAALLALTPSPFLQQGYDAFKSNKHLFFIFDYISGGDLFYHLKQKMKNNKPHRKGGFSETEEGLIILAEIFLGLEHMHLHHFIHADLKIENVMVSANGHIKIVDFGLATPITSNIQTMKRNGSITYMAPELIISKTGGRHTDWWAYGVLAFELFTGCFPWQNCNGTREELVAEISSPHQIYVPHYISAQTKHFIQQLMTYDIENRLGTISDHDIKECDYFDELNWSNLQELRYRPPFSPAELTECVSQEQKAEAMDQYDIMISK